ncbi:MAG TPA: hypothetical protein VEF72_17580 [Mycobacterium sp.]|nr:hypothetical protein [Mycobacterium sp.]
MFALADDAESEFAYLRWSAGVLINEVQFDDLTGTERTAVMSGLTEVMSALHPAVARRRRAEAAIATRLHSRGNY